MLRKGETVRIVYSKPLLEMHLCELVSRYAVVTEVLFRSNGKEKGAYVVPKTGRLKDEEWYIPVCSIESLDKINRLRCHGIIQNTIL